MVYEFSVFSSIPGLHLLNASRHLPSVTSENTCRHYQISQAIFVYNEDSCFCYRGLNYVIRVLSITVLAPYQKLEVSACTL